MRDLARGRIADRSPAVIKKRTAHVRAYVKAPQGRRLEELGKAMKTDTAVLKLPITKLIAAKKLKTKGQKRGTRYFTK